MREIEERFTQSELVLLAWRSQELHYNLKKDNPKVATKNTSIYGDDEKGPHGLPERFFAKEDIYDPHKKDMFGNPILIAKKGEVYLSQVKGEEARMYFAKLGIPLPVLAPGTPIRQGHRSKFGVE